MKLIVKIALFFVALTVLPLTVSAQSRFDAEELSIKMGKVKSSPNGDTLRVDFKLMKEGKKVFYSDILKKDAKNIFRIKEEGSKAEYIPIIDTLLDISNRQSRMDNMDIMLLVDLGSSVSSEVIESQRRIVKDIVYAYGNEARVFVSFMRDNGVTETFEKVDSARYINEIRSYFYESECSGGKQLFKSVLAKLQEMSAEQQTYFPDVKSSMEFGMDAERDKILFLFTDGKVLDEKGDYYGGNAEYTDSYLAYMDWMDRKDVNIPVYCIYVGGDAELDSDMENSLNAFSNIGSGGTMGFFRKAFTSEALQTLTMGVLDSVAPDYQLVLINPEGKRYDGSLLTLMVELLDGEDAIASGERHYSLGSKESVIVVTHDGSPWIVLLIGFLVGVVILALTYVIMQFLVPKIRYSMFLKKYVGPYSAAKFGVVEQQCYFCKEPLQEGEEVVSKCEHIVHKECWDENGGRCPEYGRHKCKTGIHYYNGEHLTDPKNATHLLPWILAGFVAGLLAWVLFFFLSRCGFMHGAMSSLVEALNPWKSITDVAEHDSLVAAMATKTSGWLQKGLSLGFFLVFFFAYVIEFRKVDLKVFGSILLRAVCGAVAGMAAMFLGSVIVTLTGKAGTNGLVDWIPYLFFALAISTVLWFKSEIKLKSALIGGCISVIFSFLVIYFVSGLYAPVIGYMVYAAGLGCSIAVVHFASEKYFLRIDGCVKERDIAIYKWMSVTGGFNKVSIGKSANCVLQMNWDKTEGISDRAVELYLEKSRPFMRVLDSGVSRQGRSLPKDTVVPMVHGTEFSIGSTRFTYIEKDV